MTNISRRQALTGSAALALSLTFLRPAKADSIALNDPVLQEMIPQIITPVLNEGKNLSDIPPATCDTVINRVIHDSDALEKITKQAVDPTVATLSYGNGKGATLIINPHDKTLAIYNNTYSFDNGYLDMKRAIKAGTYTLGKADPATPQESDTIYSKAIEAINLRNQGRKPPGIEL